MTLPALNERRAARAEAQASSRLEHSPNAIACVLADGSTTRLGPAVLIGVLPENRKKCVEGSSD
jgi:hypothetical protein